jgi:hypothetical protein
MTLQQLHVHPNPFLHTPSPPQPPARISRTISRAIPPTTIPSTDRPVSQPTHPLPRTVPLVELSFRALLSHNALSGPDLPSSDNSSRPEPNDTVLAMHYPLPLEGWDIPQPLRATLETCVPGSTDLRTPGYLPPSTDESVITGISVCPSPQHHHRTVFARHAEERFTWEHRVAGVNVGGAVPLRWRGCQWGCLSFLGGETELNNDEDREEGDVNGAGASMDTSDEAGELQVVQLVQLSLEFDDFED